MVARGWSDAQRKAYVVADNKLALNASWDDVALGLELGELQALNFDLGLTGFSLDEIGVLTADRTEGLTDPDDAPDAPSDPVSAFGDVWLLASTGSFAGTRQRPRASTKALDGASPHLMVSDPPYGVNYDPNWRNKASINRAAGRARGVIGARAVGVVKNDDRADWSEAWELFLGDAAYIWHGALHGSIVQASLEEVGFLARSQIIWVKISSSSAAGIITSSMSHAGMRCARESPVAGPATASRHPYGRLTSRGNPKPAIARRSRSSA